MALGRSEATTPTVRTDNTRAVVLVPDPFHPRITPLFQEYAQARDFLVDPARVRHPKDKARVERSMPTVRNDCYGGEQLRKLEQARERGRDWALTDDGETIHRRTRRKLREHFEAGVQSFGCCAALPSGTAPNA